MQNVERDQGDGVYLGQGEYLELLPGDEARARRDARLNHCNGIAEYEGPVYSLVTYAYNHMDNPSCPTYHPSEEAVKAAAERFQEKRWEWIWSMERDRDKHLGMTPEKIVSNAKRSGVGVARIGDPSYIMERLEDSRLRAGEIQAVINRHKDVDWKCEIKQVR
jgi:hypothetical protein